MGRVYNEAARDDSGRCELAFFFGLKAQSIAMKALVRLKGVLSLENIGIAGVTCKIFQNKDLQELVFLSVLDTIFLDRRTQDIDFTDLV